MIKILIYKLKEWYAKAKREYEQSVLEKELEAKKMQDMPYYINVSYALPLLPEVPENKTETKKGTTKRTPKIKKRG